MFFFFVLLLNSLMLLSGKQHPKKPACQGVIFLNEYYRKEKLFESLNQPTNLAIHKYTNDLFFSHIDWNSTEGEVLGFRIRKCNLYNKTCNNIHDVIDGHGVAYDRIRNDIYLGGQGIFKYKYSNDSVIQISEQDKVTHIFVQKNFYIIRDKVLYLFARDMTFRAIPEVKGMQIQTFFVSKGYSIYFTNASGLYKADSPKKPIYLLSNTLKVTQIAEDYENGGVFFSASNGIYMDDVIRRKIRKVADIPRAFGIAFWNPEPVKKQRQLIYSNHHVIFILKTSNYSAYCLAKKMNQSYTTSRTTRFKTSTLFTLGDTTTEFFLNF